MLKLILNKKKPLKILCLGAHCDDIEIGLGGTLMTLFNSYPVESVYWQVFCSNEKRRIEANKSAEIYLENIETKIIDIKDFRDGFLPYIGYEVKDHFEKIKADYQPNLIFSHYRKDLHQDHRLLCELTWNTFRNHLILGYEIPKYDGDLGKPNVYVEISPEITERKIKLLHDCFKSQVDKQWFDELTFKAIMRLRGLECAAKSGFSEALFAEKIKI
jgi:LmbE family N-acetylglucosaminyl deacetylase